MRNKTSYIRPNWVDWRYFIAYINELTVMTLDETK
jgi:hypothetical protein